VPLGARGGDAHAHRHWVAAITDKRVTFAGAKQVGGWAWAKVIAAEHQDRPTGTAIPVSDRQNASGLAYDADQAGDVLLCVDFAQAVVTDTVDALVGDFEAEWAQWASQRPGAPLPAAMV
jgi:hypothetical protein